MIKQTPESLVTFPSRPTTFLNHPEKGTLPHSCSFRKYNNDIYDLLYLCSHDLRGGSGVKVILDNFQSFDPIQVYWSFYIDPKASDYKNLTEYQKSKLAYAGVFSEEKINVADSMEGEELGLGGCSIEESWLRFIEYAKQGKSILVDLSELRPNGSVNDKGLTATGAIGDGTESSNTSSFFAIYDAIANHLGRGDVLSFLQLLGTLNATLRRGGLYKNGIITSSMVWTNPNFVDYMNAPLITIPGSHKKAVKYTQDTLEHEDLLELISEKRNTESVFLEPLYEDDLHANVCEAILSKPNGTCLINRLNIAQCKKSQDIVDGLVEATLKLCALHTSWRGKVGDRANIYLPLEEDRQIGVDILGFANFLAAQKVTYLEFTDALDYILNGVDLDCTYSAIDIAKSLCIAYGKSTKVADKYMSDRDLPLLDRIHTIEPSQSHAYTCKDLAGFTTARSIFAPMGRKDKRTSDSQKQKVYFHGDVETAVEIGGELHQRFIELWQQMMDTYGRPHAISFDTWLPCTPDWLRWFIPSRIQTAYYQFAETHDQSYLSKKVQTCDITLKAKEGCSVCGE